MSEAAANLRIPADLPPPCAEQLDRQSVLASGWFDQAEGYQKYRRPGTDTWLLFFTRTGRGFMRGPSGAATIVVPGDLHIYRPDVWHDYGTVKGSGWAFHFVHFHPRPAWTEWLRFEPVEGIDGLVHANIQSEEVSRRLVEAFERIHRDTLLAGVWRTELAMNALEHILLLAGEATGLGRSPLDPRVQAVMERIATRPGDDHSIQTLARLVNLSPSRFAHLFKAETGQSPIRFALETRLGEAAKLIELTNDPVAVIAEAVGFRSTFHFSSSFRARYGDSPRNYRRKRLANDDSGD